MATAKKASVSKRGRKDAHGNTIMPDDPKYLPKKKPRRPQHWYHEPTPGQKRTQEKQETYVRKSPLFGPFDNLPEIPEDFFDTTSQQKAVRSLVRLLNRCEQRRMDTVQVLRADLASQALEFEEQLAAADQRYNRFTEHANTVIQGLRAQLNPVEPKTAMDGFAEKPVETAPGVIWSADALANKGKFAKVQERRWQEAGLPAEAMAQGPIERGLTAIDKAEKAVSDIEVMLVKKYTDRSAPWYKRAWRWLWW